MKTTSITLGAGGISVGYGVGKDDGFPFIALASKDLAVGEVVQVKFATPEAVAMLADTLRKLLIIKRAS